MKYDVLVKRILISLCILLILPLSSCQNIGATLPANSEIGPTAVEESFSETVILYSSMQENQLIAIKTAFEKKYPSIEMQYYFAGTSKVITKIATEVQAGQISADVIWVGDPSDYVWFKEQNLLAKYISPESKNINPEFVDPEGYYTGARTMNMGIAYNLALVSPEEAPKTWYDLLDPIWKDQIVLTDPGNSGTSKYWRDAIMCNPNYGANYIQKLKDNGCVLESGTTSAHGQLAYGNYKVGICLDYISLNLALEGENLAFVYPEDTISICSPIGLVEDCKNETNGKLLYDFILSKEGQQILVDNSLISVRNDMAQGGIAAVHLTEKIMQLDIKEIHSNEESNSVKFDEIFDL